MWVLGAPSSAVVYLLKCSRGVEILLALGAHSSAVNCEMLQLREPLLEHYLGNMCRSQLELYFPGIGHGKLATLSAISEVGGEKMKTLSAIMSFSADSQHSFPRSGGPRSKCTGGANILVNPRTQVTRGVSKANERAIAQPLTT